MMDRRGMTYTEQDVAGWAAVASQLYELAVTDDQSRKADHAAAMIMSGSGFQPPTDVHQMFLKLITVGYIQALRDVRDGDYDDELQEWRPDLTE